MYVVSGLVSWVKKEWVYMEKSCVHLSCLLLLLCYIYFFIWGGASEGMKCG